jgi:membrane dipeptidase
MLIVDAHEDLAWNMQTFGRDYTLSAAETRLSEAGTPIPSYNDDSLLGWPEYQRGQVAVVFGTLFAAPLRRCSGVWDQVCYADDEQAHRLYKNQIDVYKRLVDQNADKFQLLRTRPDLERVLAAWENMAADNGSAATSPPVGLVILMEGAEGVRQAGELEDWREQGVRIIGPAWAGNRFCGGTGEPGPLTIQGRALLDRMAELGFALDLSHMDEAAVLQALDQYPGSILASHSNARALLNGATSNRHLSDRVIQGILERDGLIGVVPFNAFLKVGWRRGDHREEVGLNYVVAQIDYLCQMAGDARHVGLGTDFDGGFGLQCTPVEIDSIADMQKLVPLLAEKGYSEEDTAAIMGRNWLDRLRQILPDNL